MIEAESLLGIKWEWTDEGRTLVVKKETSNGIKEFSTNWKFAPSKELIDKALNSMLCILDNKNNMVLGQQNRFYKKGKWFYEICTGPPTWWYPRIELKFKKHFLFRIGWIRIGLGVWR